MKNEIDYPINISNMIVDKSFVISISMDDAIRIKRMLDKVLDSNSINKYYTTKYLVDLIGIKLDLATFENADTIRLSYEEASKIYKVIKLHIEADPDDLVGNRNDDDNAIFGDDAIAWERIIDCIVVIENKDEDSELRNLLLKVSKDIENRS